MKWNKGVVFGLNSCADTVGIVVRLAADGFFGMNERKKFSWKIEINVHDVSTTGTVRSSFVWQQLRASEITENFVVKNLKIHALK